MRCFFAMSTTIFVVLVQLSLAMGASGPAQFEQVNIFNTNGVNSLSVGDLNRDGLDDIACGCTDGRLFRYAQTSTIGFFTSLQIDNLGQAINVKIGEISGDAYNDIAVVRSDGSLHREFSTGSDSFAYALIGSYGAALTGPEICDLNQDGRNDILVDRHSDGAFSVRYQNGSGGFTYALLINYGAGTHAIAAGHLDDTTGTLVNDFVVGREYDGVLYAEFQTTPGSFSHVLLDTFSSPINGVSAVTLLKVADLNGDGRQDILVICEDGKIYRETQIPLASRNFFRTTLVDFAQQMNAIAVDDMNHDTLNDIVIGLADGTVSILYQQDDGTFTNVTNASFPGESIAAIDTGDFSNDGYRDFVVGFGSGAVYAFYQRGCSPALAGDLNNDCEVKFDDFAIMASHWMECSLVNQTVCSN
ncbi:MAG: hypothetical protein A2Y12_02415 [Planctomycetes bacterium GWF2_42_9]|nr:MAG: hypothetical protein A2Y12_02415 [Planctomycetes bacterium GWF2_42_9]